MMILDASVAAKWFLADESLLVEASALRDALLTERIKLSAPPAIWTEVANGLVRAARRRRIDSSTVFLLADQALEVSRLVDNIIVEPREIVLTALSIGIGAYDAEYLAAARQTGLPVITADQGMLERGRAHGYDVVWLGDVTLRDGVLVDTPQGYQ
jgi:predicted nucleic acid-binding protein